jgi:hypothetical protein
VGGDKAEAPRNGKVQQSKPLTVTVRAIHPLEVGSSGPNSALVEMPAVADQKKVTLPDGVLHPN